MPMRRNLCKFTSGIGFDQVSHIWTNILFLLLWEDLFLRLPKYQLLRKSATEKNKRLVFGRIGFSIHSILVVMCISIEICFDCLFLSTSMISWCFLEMSFDCLFYFYDFMILKMLFINVTVGWSKLVWALFFILLL